MKAGKTLAIEKIWSIMIFSSKIDDLEWIFQTSGYPFTFPPCNSLIQQKLCGHRTWPMDFEWHLMWHVRRRVASDLGEGVIWCNVRPLLWASPNAQGETSLLTVVFPSQSWVVHSLGGRWRKIDFKRRQRNPSSHLDMGVSKNMGKPPNHPF